MTGLEWYACADPRQMVELLRSRVGIADRRWRLFAAAYWRWKADFLGESRQEVLESVELMEQLAETGRLPRGLRTSRSEERIFFAAEAVQSAIRTAEYAGNGGRAADAQVQTEVLRDLFGNPFRAVAINNHWRTADVMDLAGAIHEDRVFERMPILADALIDAGCEDERLLGHCRSDARHVRGCWALDLLLRHESHRRKGER